MDLRNFLRLSAVILAEAEKGARDCNPIIKADEISTGTFLYIVFTVTPGSSSGVAVAV